MENWVNSIHSACAAAFARHRGKTGTLHLLQEEIFRLEKAIESVSNFFLKKIFMRFEGCTFIFILLFILYTNKLSCIFVLFLQYSRYGKSIVCE